MAMEEERKGDLRVTVEVAASKDLRKFIGRKEKEKRVWLSGDVLEMW